MSFNDISELLSFRLRCGPGGRSKGMQRGRLGGQLDVVAGLLSYEGVALGETKPLSTLHHRDALLMLATVYQYVVYTALTNVTS